MDSSVNGLPSQFKFGGQYIERTRDFTSRRFRFLPVDTSDVDLSDDPESIFAADNIGPAYEVKEETRTTDTYAAKQTIGAGYGMADVALSTTTRLRQRRRWSQLQSVPRWRLRRYRRRRRMRRKPSSNRSCRAHARQPIPQRRSTMRSPPSRPPQRRWWRECAAVPVASHAP